MCRIAKRQITNSRRPLSTFNEFSLMVSKNFKPIKYWLSQTLTPRNSNAHLRQYKMYARVISRGTRAMANAYCKEPILCLSGSDHAASSSAHVLAAVARSFSFSNPGNVCQIRSNLPLSRRRLLLLRTAFSARPGGRWSQIRAVGSCQESSRRRKPAIKHTGPERTNYVYHIS
jgi:hypothetical protein